MFSELSSSHCVGTNSPSYDRSAGVLRALPRRDVVDFAQSGFFRERILFTVCYKMTSSVLRHCWLGNMKPPCKIWMCISVVVAAAAAAAVASSSSSSSMLHRLVFSDVVSYFLMIWMWHRQTNRHSLPLYPRTSPWAWLKRGNEPKLMILSIQSIQRSTVRCQSTVYKLWTFCKKRLRQFADWYRTLQCVTRSCQCVV